MKAYEAIATALVEEGCDRIFGLMGDGNIDLLGALGKKQGIALYWARHEAGAVAMADGFHRGSGRIGVATVTSGPGLTQIATSLTVAVRNGSQLVVLAGDTPARSANRTQELDQRRFVESCGARFQPLSGPDSVAEEVRMAFYAARTTNVPVVLNLPIDIQNRELAWDLNYTPSSEFLSPDAAFHPDLRRLEAIGTALARAERPVIIAGRGAVRAGARDALVRLAEQAQALVGTTLLAKGFFAGHRYDLGIAGSFSSAASEKLLAEADFVLGVGAELGYFTTEGGLLFPQAEIARIDVKPVQEDIDFVPSLYLRADARLAAEALITFLDQGATARKGYRSTEVDVLLEAEYPLPHRTNDGVDPRRLMMQLSQELPGDSVVVCGLGHFWSFPAMYLDLPEGGQIEFCHQFSCIGQTLPIAIGLAVARPDRPHIVLEGDGSLMMHVQEIETAARHGVGLVVVLFNDGGYGAEVHKLKAKGFDPSLAQLTTPDFVGLARALGCDGAVLEHEDDLPKVMRTALTARGPFVIDARISATTVSDPYKRIHFGIPNAAPRQRGRAPAKAL